jgi:alcohol dehydrogenase
MKALVYHGPGRRFWEDVPEPQIVDSEDAVVRVDAVTICGTDLHILKGDVPEVESGRVLGHEAVGTVERVGASARQVSPGDRVLLSCISACGRCRYCREASYGQCLGGGGWILGHRIDGTQAERVRVPFADASTYQIPEHVSDEAALMLADILPTAYEVGVLRACIAPSDTVVIVGAGPIGLAVVLTARLLSPSKIIVLDPATARLEAAKACGADVVFSDAEHVRAELPELTDGLGADVAIEAVGVPETFELCTDLVRPGGHVANIGVHGSSATFHLETLWTRNVTVTTGLVDTFSTSRLLRMVANKQIDTRGLVTHRFGLDEMQDAYDVFGRAQETGALKVALFRA